MKNQTKQPELSSISSNRLYNEGSVSEHYTKFISTNNSIFNYADYETAKALLVEIKNIFENHLKSSSNNATSQSIDSHFKH